MLSLAITMEERSRGVRQSLPDARCEALLAGIAQGDAADFEAFYRETDRMIYAYALSFTRNHQDAQDVMMDTYLKIRAAAHLYKPQGKPLAWVLTIVKNLALTHLKKARAEIALEEVSEGEMPFVNSDGAEEDVVLQCAIRILSEQERQIVFLHAVSGFKHREIAQFLQLPLSTVLSKYTRALAKLRQQLSAQDEGVPV